MNETGVVNCAGHYPIIEVLPGRKTGFIALGSQDKSESSLGGPASPM